jgi:hypothetical protein
VSRSRGERGDAAKFEIMSTCGYVAFPPHSLQHVLPLVGGVREGGGGEGGSLERGSGSTSASPSVKGETRVNVNEGHVTHPRVTFPAVERTVSDTASTPELLRRIVTDIASSPATHHTAPSHAAPSHTTHTTEISYVTSGSRSTREPGVHAAWFQKYFGKTSLQQTAASKQGGFGGGSHFSCFTGTKVHIMTQHK